MCLNTAQLRNHNYIVMSFKQITSLLLLRRFNPAESVVEKSVIL